MTPDDLRRVEAAADKVAVRLDMVKDQQTRIIDEVDKIAAHCAGCDPRGVTSRLQVLTLDVSRLQDRVKLVLWVGAIVAATSLAGVVSSISTLLKGG